MKKRLIVSLLLYECMHTEVETDVVQGNIGLMVACVEEIRHPAGHVGVRILQCQPTIHMMTLCHVNGKYVYTRLHHKEFSHGKLQFSVSQTSTLAST